MTCVSDIRTTFRNFCVAIDWTQELTLRDADTMEKVSGNHMFFLTNNNWRTVLQEFLSFLPFYSMVPALFFLIGPPFTNIFLCGSSSTSWRKRTWTPAPSWLSPWAYQLAAQLVLPIWHSEWTREETK